MIYFLYLSHTFTKELLTEASAEQNIEKNKMMFRSLKKNLTMAWLQMADPMKGMGDSHP